MKDPAEPLQDLMRPRHGSFGTHDPTKFEDKIYRRGEKYKENADRFFAHD